MAGEVVGTAEAGPRALGCWKRPINGSKATEVSRLGRKDLFTKKRNGEKQSCKAMGELGAS